MIRCIDNKGNEKTLIDGKEYQFRGYDNEMIEILDETGNWDWYCIEAFEDWETLIDW